MATLSPQTIRSALSQVCQVIFSSVSSVVRRRPALQVEIPTSHLLPVFKLPTPSPFDTPLRSVQTYKRPAAPMPVAPVYFSPPRIAIPPPRMIQAQQSPVSFVDVEAPFELQGDQAPINWKPVFFHSDNSPSSPSTTESQFMERNYPPTPVSVPSPIFIDPFKTRFSADDAELYFTYYDPEDPSPRQVEADTPEFVFKSSRSSKKSKSKQPKDRRTVKKSFKKSRTAYTQRSFSAFGVNEVAPIKLSPPEYVHRSSDDVRIFVL